MVERVGHTDGRSPGAGCRRRSAGSRSGGFTLIELILVMAILTMAVSVTAPVLANFFRGRTLDSEARRLLALVRSGQNRAISEGIPIDLWIDTGGGPGSIGLEAEPSFEKEDARKVSFDLDSGIHIEVSKPEAPTPPPSASNPLQLVSTASVPTVHLTHPGVPTIRFLPDGTISDDSPTKIRLVARDGSSLWVAQAKDKLSYEIRTHDP